MSVEPLFTASRASMRRRARRLVGGIVASWAIAAHADGVAVGATSNGLAVLKEKSQSALIWWEDGQEHLLLLVSLDTENTRGRLLWITPIPAPPSDVKIEVLSGMPTLDGLDIGSKASSRTKLGLGVMAATQIWPAPAILSALTVREPPRSLVPAEDPAQLQHEGVVLEVIAASSLEGVETRARELGFALSQPVRQALDRYVSPKGSFIAYRIDETAAAHDTGKPLRLGINAVFPSTNGYFPLRASSASPVETLDISVTALGFVKSMGSGPAGLRTSYFLGSQQMPSVGAHVPTAPFPAASDRFTRFELVGAPSSLTSDLNFAPGAPVAITLATSLLMSPYGAFASIAIAVALFVSVAAVVSVAARGIWPRETRPRKRTLAVLGLLHLATVVGPLIGSLLVARRLGAPRLRALAFVAVVSFTLTVVFVALVVVARHLGL